MTTETIEIRGGAVLHITGGGTIRAWKEQVSYVKGRGPAGSTVTVQGFEFDVTESIGDVFRLLNA